MSSPPPRIPIPRLDELDLVIATARLRLRPLDERDVEDLWPLVSDPDLPRMMIWAAHTDRSQTLAFIVIEKLGFRMVGRQEEDAWRDGRWWAMLSYELTSPEWSDVSTTMRVHRPVP